MLVQALQQAVFRPVEASSIRSRRSQAVFGHCQGAHVYVCRRSQAVFWRRQHAHLTCISQGSTSAGLEHTFCHLDDLVEGLDHGSSLLEQLVHTRLRDARPVGHLMKRGHVLQVGDGEVGSAHALLDAPPEHVVGLRELLQYFQGLGVQLGQRALGVLENVLHLLGHDTGVGQLALLISFAYGISVVYHMVCMVAFGFYPSHDV